MKWEYRMSMSGSCSRLISAYRLGKETEPTPDWLEDIAKESERHEEWVVQDLREDGLVILTCPKCPICARKGLDRHGIHVEIERPLYKLVGHLDGLILESINGPVLHILEIKGLSRFRYKAWIEKGWEAFPAFAHQVTCYMAAAESCSPPLLFVAKNRDTGEKDELQVVEPPMDIREIYEKYDFIEANARAGIQVSCDQEEGSPIAKYCRCLDCPHREKQG